LPCGQAQLRRGNIVGILATFAQLGRGRLPAIARRAENVRVHLAALADGDLPTPDLLHRVEESLRENGDDGDVVFET
jgi:hypothetical protein